MAPDHKHLEGIPLSLVGPVDLGRVMRELDSLDNQLHELAIRQPGQEIKMPKTTIIMDQLIAMNKLNLLLEADRKTLKQFLAILHKRAPRLHISFSADPSPLFIEKLMTWIRREIHPVVLLTVGLEPNIGAGCLVRTTNKYFDLSLARDFAKKRDALMQALRDMPAAEQPAAAVTATPVVAGISESLTVAPAPDETSSASAGKTYLSSPHSPASATVAPGEPKLPATGAGVTA